MQRAKETLWSDQANFYTNSLKLETKDRSAFEQFSVPFPNDVPASTMSSFLSQLTVVPTSSFLHFHVPTNATSTATGLTSLIPTGEPIIIAKQTRIPDAANGSTLIRSLVSFESQPLLNSGNFESMTNTAEISHRNDSIPCPFLDSIIPLALSASDALSAPQLMWLSGRPMLLVAEVRGSIPANHRGWSRR